MGFPNAFRSNIAASKSFEETLRTSYSHGLESIYAIEKIDLKTVRPLQLAPPPEESFPEGPKSPLLSSEKKEEFHGPLELDLGDAHKGWMESFVLSEPIQMLNLSPHSQRCLLASYKKQLQDLVTLGPSDWLAIKGLGQGHIDEVQKKLRQYLAGRPLYRCRLVDFAAFVRSLIGDTDRRKVTLLLDRYHLSGFLALSPAERAELRCLDTSTRSIWENQALSLLLSNQTLVEKQLSRITEVFLKPWMRVRLGMATQKELYERLQRISYQPQMTVLILDFLSSLYFTGKFPFKKGLHSVENELYFVDEHAFHMYHQVIEKADSYFYQHGLDYPLEILCRLLTKEFALQWKAFPEGFIEKCLRLSELERGRSDVLCPHRPQSPQRPRP